MKKFLIELAAILSGCLILLIIVNFAYCNLKKTETETDKFAYMPESIKVCNVGSSHGKNSFDYSQYEDMGCFNFGLTSQRFQYDYRLLENYSDRLEEGAIVFIPFSYFSIWGTADELRDDFDSMNNRYYRILPPRLIINYDPWVDICEHYLPVLSAYDDMIDVFKDAILGDGANSSFYEKEIDFDKDSEDAYAAQVLAYRDENGERIVNEDRVRALSDIINLCKEKGARPVLITTPLTYVFTDKIKERDPEFLEDFYKTAHEIADENGIEYYDYSMDDRLCGNTDYFIDSHHLNSDGAKLFTGFVMDEIVK